MNDEAAPLPRRPGVKICGLTRPDDALACLEAGADWIGLNFHPLSPRFATPEQAGAILDALPDRSTAVGLFVDRKPADVREVARDLGLVRVQLHGDEPPEDLLGLDGLFVVRAFRLRDAAAIAAMAAWLQRADRLGRPPDAVLIDGWAPGLAGGTGATIADDLFASLPPLPRLMLAGGLTPENVADRARLARPWMVDAASGVELSPGRKDPARVRAFVEALGG